MGKHIWLLGLVTWLLTIGVFAEEESNKTTASASVYDVLRSNGLPVGLLPKGVKSYTLHDDGQLEVYLEKPCFAKFENQVYFQSVIRGNLSYGQLAGVAGLEQQELFLWFPVKDIRVDIPNSGFIYFDVGVVYKQFVLSLFENPPDCKPENSDEHLTIQMPQSKVLGDRLPQSIGGKACKKGNNVSRRAIE